MRTIGRGVKTTQGHLDALGLFTRRALKLWERAKDSEVTVLTFEAYRFGGIELVMSPSISLGC